MACVRGWWRAVAPAAALILGDGAAVAAEPPTPAGIELPHGVHLGANGRYYQDQCDAARGLDLVLIARRKEPLEETAGKIIEQYGVKVNTVVCDLADADATQQIVTAIGDSTIDFMVYNAALSYIGPYLDTGLSTHTDIAKVNMVTPMAMLHYFGGKMAERGKGGIVIMASIAGFQGSGYLATYAATKAFNRVLAEGLWYEWKPKGVDV